VTAAPPSDAERERLYGLLLFDAEEGLARGDVEKAMVLASKAVRERPDSLTARALVERARRELTRGKRRERLEARIDQAQRNFEAGDFAAAEKIVSSALKLIPDHAAALALYVKLRERPRAGAIEDEIERELARLAHGQAQKALEAGRAAHAAGWDRRALFHVRRGLRQVPDHAELLALLREVQGVVEAIEKDRARRRALNAQVRAGLELLAAGQLEDSLRILRAVLADDPENARAQAAIQELRRATLAGLEPPAAPAGALPLPKEQPRPRAWPPPAAPPDLVADRSLPLVPVEILLPRTRRQRTPALVVLAGAALVGGALIAVSLSGRGALPPAPRAAAVAAPPAGPAGAAAAKPETAPPGPLDVIEPGLRSAIEATLSAYAQALERADAQALAAARPDLAPAAREERLRPFVGALNAATDIRVLDAAVSGTRAQVEILSTDVIIGGRAAAPAAARAETLVFERRQGTWALRPR
jgi:tetratricopeptide (TPR) repeat protein